MNDRIIKVVKSKVEMGMTKADQVYKDMFTSSGMPQFAVPKEVIFVLELVKIILSTKQNIGINKTRIKKAIFMIATDFFGIDRKILDFLPDGYFRIPRKVA